MGAVAADSTDHVGAVAAADDLGVTRAGPGGRRLSLSPLDGIEYLELPPPNRSPRELTMPRMLCDLRLNLELLHLQIDRGEVIRPKLLTRSKLFRTSFTYDRGEKLSK